MGSCVLRPTHFPTVRPLRKTAEFGAQEAQSRAAKRHSRRPTRCSRHESRYIRRGGRYVSARGMHARMGCCRCQLQQQNRHQIGSQRVGGLRRAAGKVEARAASLMPKT
eukprot:363048-Chlamydomonas_euryale.AAC.7